MGGVAKKTREGVFGLDPLGFLDPESPEPSPAAEDPSPAPSAAESTESARGRLAAERKRRRQQKFAVSRLGGANLRVAGLGA